MSEAITKIISLGTCSCGQCAITFHQAKDIRDYMKVECISAACKDLDEQTAHQVQQAILGVE